MKRIMQLLVVTCIMLLGTQMTFAMFDGSVPGKSQFFNADEFMKVKSIAVAPALYTPNPKEPTWSELMQIMDVAKSAQPKDSVIKYVDYDTAKKQIMTDTGDLLDNATRREATKSFKADAVNLADAYVELTVTNGSKHMNFIFDVYKSGTNELLYSYKEAVASYSGRNASSYANACKNFYKVIDQAQKDAANDKEKQERKKNHTDWNLNS